MKKLIIALVMVFVLLVSGCVSYAEAWDSDPEFAGKEVFKIETMKDGTYTDGTFKVTVDFSDDGMTCSWKSNLPIRYWWANGDKGGFNFSYWPSTNEHDKTHAASCPITDLVFFYNKPLVKPILVAIATEPKSADTSKVPVIMYHHFKEDVKPGEYGTTMSPTRFEEHLKALKDNGYETVSLKQLVTGNIPKKPVIITIDDGYLSNYTYAYPLLKKYGMHAIIFVVVSSVGDTKSGTPKFTWNQAREMQESGYVDIQCHGLTHDKHAELSTEEFMVNMYKSMEILQKNVGFKEVKAFSYPHGSYNDSTRSYLKKIGFEVQFTGMFYSAKYANSSDLSNVVRLSVGGDMTGGQLIGKIERR